MTRREMIEDFVCGCFINTKGHDDVWWIDDVEDLDCLDKALNYLFKYYFEEIPNGLELMKKEHTNVFEKPYDYWTVVFAVEKIIKKYGADIKWGNHRKVKK